MSIFFDPDWDENPKKKRKKKTRGKRKKKNSFSLRGLLFKWGIISFIWGSFAFLAILGYFASTLPDVNKVFKSEKVPTIKLIDNAGNVIGRFGQEYGKAIRFEQMPQVLIDAVTSTEDRKFFRHFGIDILGLMRASFANYKAGKIIQGGSTITQQLAKISFLSSERTFRRKIQEVMLALYLEHKFSKQQIFSLYLNRVYFGAGNYGIDAAARSYFGCEVKNLNLHQAAMLAGLIQAPSRYAPTSNYDLAVKRANEVLMNMYENGKLASANIIKQNVNNNPYKISHDNKSYFPYFAQWVKDQLPNYIGADYDHDIIVKTTIDSHLQDIAENIVTTRLSASGRVNNVSQAAMVVLSPRGEILAMVGGVDHAKSQFNHATQAQRQPGSSFKTIVYLTALEQGFAPHDNFVDAPITIGRWRPSNWNNKYLGEVQLDYALANSINSVAVRLAQKVGINNVVNLGHRLGISSDISSNLSTALGASEVNLLELTNAYAHLDSGGNAVVSHGILEINDNTGANIYHYVEPEPKRILSENVVAQMNNMLEKVITQGTGKRARIDRPAAGKTGTSQDARDAWFIGFTADYIVGVWVGNDDNSPMKNVAGGSLPAEIWKDFMLKANINKPVTDIMVKRDGSIFGIPNIIEVIHQVGPVSNETIPSKNEDNGDLMEIWHNIFTPDGEESSDIGKENQ